MRIKSLISLVAVACVLMVAFSPLTARNTPFPEDVKDTKAHPWQDDNQYYDPETRIQIHVPLGPIVISIDVPINWFVSTKSNTQSAANPTRHSVKSARPMSLDKKGDIR